MTSIIIIIFLLGYAAIVFEEQIKINKTASLPWAILPVVLPFCNGE